MSDSGFIPDDRLPRYTPDKLWTIRKRELGITQEKLAEEANCDPKTVQRYESGESPIPLELIRTVERLRAEDRERRAREGSADQIDFSGVDIPGLKLVELIPNVHVRELLGKLARTFVAVPTEWLVPDAEGGQPSPVPGMGPSPSRRRRRQAASVTRAEFWVGMAGLACVCALILGSMGLAWSDLRDAVRSARSARFARDSRVERPAAPTAQRAPKTTDEQEPDETLSDNASNGSEGAPALKRIQMPKKPYSWQKRGPCGQGEIERIGGCWVHSDSPPPCADVAVEGEGACWVPVPAKPAKPNSVEPNK